MAALVQEKRERVRAMLDEDRQQNEIRRRSPLLDPRQRDVTGHSRNSAQKDLHASQEHQAELRSGAILTKRQHYGQGAEAPVLLLISLEHQDVRRLLFDRHDLDALIERGRA
jgi:hypothetical protein